MRIISQGQGHGLRLIEARRPSSLSESIFIWNSHNIKSGLTGSMMRACGGCNIHGSGARWMDRFFLLHVDFHIWVIKFIIWLAAALACDYSGYGTQGALLYVTCGNKGGSRPSPESLCGCWKKNCSVWLLWSGTVFSSVYLLPSVPFPPFSSQPLANISSWLFCLPRSWLPWLPTGALWAPHPSSKYS